MNGSSDQMYLAATRYYLQDHTMEAIARDLGVSRSTVSRMLSAARATGLVRISIADVAGGASPLARELADAAGVRVHLVGAPSTASPIARLDLVARRAAGLFADMVADERLVGVAWGSTMAAMTRHLPRRPLQGTTVVQMNGGANQRTSGVRYVSAMLHTIGESFDSDVVLFPVPAFFDYPETKQAMWRERSVLSVLDLLTRLDVAAFGIGSMEGRIPSHVYSAGYLDEAERRALTADGVVGDVCTVLIRQDGTYADIEANNRATGLTPAELARIPRRLCAVADPHRAPAVAGALRAGVATDLVIDEASARATLRLLGRSP